MQLAMDQSDAPNINRIPAVEDITDRLNRMNVDNINADSNLIDHNCPMDYSEMITQEQPVSLDQLSGEKQQDDNSTLIVTNVDPLVFTDKSVQSQFESLFQAYDSNITFRYLKSFRRVRLDFTDARSAEKACSLLSRCPFGSTEFRCYITRFLRPGQPCFYKKTSTNNNNQLYSTHLTIPKPTKQFLISPPASPPVGWEPVTENSPCIDVQLISALANLVPGKLHEIHPASESQPGIFVEVCDDPKFESSNLACSRSIPRTPNPGFHK